MLEKKKNEVVLASQLRPPLPYDLIYLFFRLHRIRLVMHCSKIMKFMLLFVRTNTPLHIIKKKKRVNPKKNNVNADGVPLHTRFADPSSPFQVDYWLETSLLAIDFLLSSPYIGTPHVEVKH